ncbi:AAA family ATPase [Rhizobium sp. 3T7]|uniref:AAA family ATPase n=1 Tax=Rhizobium sp. 3T7 TaxID=2874922 RepID=UPI001CCCF0E7|nr:AAA family ATPase [Rhizobium sp. 3T7]MBZ9791681.1 AAA family ATPase [Rhizobium sp. 3T7]
MRINRLDLTRYGKFTDGVIDFGSTAPGSPDLHVIYGPNEAGKSTTFDAVLDLIFGIGTTSRYGFLHPYSSMRIGGSIKIAGEDREFVRIKRPQNSLLDANGRVVPDALIRTDLGGIDRDAFTTMFSLDEKTLEKGGEGILASKGDLGELLFSASAGLSDVSRHLSAIRADADVFYRYKARSGLLVDFKKRLADLKAQRDELDLQVTEFQRLTTDRKNLGRAHDEALEQRAATQRRMDEVKRILAGLGPMARLSAARHELAQTEDVPYPPASWRGELADLRAEEVEGRVRLEQVRKSIARTEQELEDTPADQRALDLASRVAELSDFQPRYITAENDIPKLSARVAELSIENILVQLGRSGEIEPARLLLDAQTVGTLRALIEAKSGVDTRTASAKDELKKVERAIAAEEENGGVRAEVSPDTARAFEHLAATLKAIPRSDEEVAFRALSRRRDAASVAQAEALSRLLPWRGAIAELSSMVTPSAARIDQWKAASKDAQDKARTARADLDRLEPEAKRIAAELAAVRSQVGEIEEARAIASRASRDEAWAAHRRMMDATSADAFEDAMKSDDRLVSQRLLHFAEIGRMGQLLQRDAALRTDIETASESYRDALDNQNSLRLQISNKLAAFASDGGMDADPFEVEDWLRKRDVALRAREELAGVDQEIADLRDRVARSKKLLVDAMSAVNAMYHPDADIAALFAAAEDALSDFTIAASRAKEIVRLHKELKERQQAFTDASRIADEWELEWKRACDGCWLAELGAAQRTGAVAEILAALEKLASAIESRDSLIDRVQKMEKDRALFEGKVFELCKQLSIPLEGSTRELAAFVYERLSIAEDGRDRRKKLAQELGDLRKDEVGLTSAREVLDARLAEMFEFFGATTLGEVEARIEVSGRRRMLQRSISALEQELLEGSGKDDMSKLEDMIASADRELLEDELARLMPVLADQDGRCSEIFHLKSKAQDALDIIGGDERVAEIEEQRRTTLLEIEESARRYMELRAGVAAAEQGLRLYRERHRSGMMARASSAFNTISRGAYKGVAAQPGKEGEVLIAVSASGGSNAANELSKGARFQLYLALRVAGYHEVLGNRPPVPFVADDIMESFDDFRAEETFRLFAEMAQRGQVVYLTHHRHLIDIARSVCPSVRVHDLDAISVSRRPDAVAAE